MLKSRYENFSFENLDLRQKDYLDNLIYSTDLSKKIKEYFESQKNTPLYIAVTGSWGSGKSTVVNTSIKIIEEEMKVKVFKYDAWKYEGDSFRRTFTRNILDNSGLKQNTKEYKEFYNRLYDDRSIETESLDGVSEISEHNSTTFSYKTLLIILAISVLLFLVIAIFFQEDILSQYNTFVAIIGLVGGTPALIRFLVGSLKKYMSVKKTYIFQKLFSPEQFYDTVKDILKKVSETNKIILIDNIDRCNIDEFKQTIASIKGFFDTDGKIVYIIPFDTEQFSLAFNNEYNSYSEKVFDFTIDIKEKSQKNIIEFMDKLLESEKEYMDIFTTETIDIIALSGCKTPRQIINICNDFVNEYNIFVEKNNIKVVNLSRDHLSYLMKYTILKRYYNELFKKVHTNIDIIKRLEKHASRRDLFDNIKKDYPWISYEAYTFLRKTANTNPINYDYFYSSQSKDDFDIDDEILNYIQLEDYSKIEEKITESQIQKEQIICYLKKRIIYEKNRNSWKFGIAPKIRLIMYLTKKEKLSIQEINNNFGFILRDDDFYKKIIYTREIKLEETIDFINIISLKNFKKDKLAIKLYDALKDGHIICDESEKYEVASKILSKLKLESLDEEQQLYFQKHMDYLIGKHLFSNVTHIEILKSSINKYITLDQIKKMLDISNSNDVNCFNFLTDLVNVGYKVSNDQDLINRYINFINRIQTFPKQKSFYDKLFKLLDENKNNDQWIKSINNIRITSIQDEFLDFNSINIIFNIFKENNFTNFKNILLSLTKVENKEYIVDKLILEKELNSPLNLFFKDFILKLNTSEFKNFLQKITLLYEKLDDSNKSWFNQYIKNNYNDLIGQFFDLLELHENKDSFAEYIVNLTNTYENKLKNIKFFMTSEERFEKLISNQNDLIQLENIYNESNEHYKDQVLNRIIRIIEGKTSIINNDLEVVIRILSAINVKKKYKKMILNSLGINKTNQSDLKRIFENLEFSSTIEKEYKIIQSYLIENNLIVVEKKDKTSIKN